MFEFPRRNLFVVFSDMGQADKFATCLPVISLMDRNFPNLENTLDAVFSFNLSANVSAHPFLYISITFHRSDRWLQQL